MTKIAAPKSRDDLSFTAREDGGRLKNWAVPHQDRHSNWHCGVEVGKNYFAEVAALSDYSEKDAYDAIRFAITAWTCGPGIECGFTETMAKVAIVGLRALRNGAPAYDPNVRSSDERIRRRKRSALETKRRRQMVAAARRDPNFQNWMRAVTARG